MSKSLRRIIGSAYAALILSGCVIARPSSLVVPADSTKGRSHIGADLLALGVIGAFVLVLIPQASKPWK